MVQCKRKVSSFKTKKRLVTCPEDWVIVEDTHEAIIDEITWGHVQRHLEASKRAASNNIVKTNSLDDANLFSGKIKCADCGAAMAFIRRERKASNDKKMYRCSRYNNNGKDTCTTHTIDAEVLESVILADIQHHAKQAVKDERGLLDRLLSFSGTERQNKKAAQKKALCGAESRILFIHDASKKLLEEKITGNVPDSLFKKMLADYDKELAELEEKASSIRRDIAEKAGNETDVLHWMELIKECLTLDRLDRAMAYQLIDHVAIHEQEDEIGLTRQSISVKYNFVGCLS